MNVAAQVKQTVAEEQSTHPVINVAQLTQADPLRTNPLAHAHVVPDAMKFPATLQEMHTLELEQLRHPGIDALQAMQLVPDR